MTELPIITRPPTGSEELLKKKFAESIAAQSDQMDSLARQLITLELAIPGLYATVLKLVSGKDATLPLSAALYATFFFWAVALALTLYSLFPKTWQVDRSIMQQDPAKKTGTLGLEDFFNKTAKHKRKYLTIASALFFAGIVSAALTIF